MIAMQVRPKGFLASTSTCPLVGRRHSARQQDDLLRGPRPVPDHERRVWRRVVLHRGQERPAHRQPRGRATQPVVAAATGDGEPRPVWGAVEGDRQVPACQNLTVCGQQLWLSPDRSRQPDHPAGRHYGGSRAQQRHPTQVRTVGNGRGLPSLEVDRLISAGRIAFEYQVRLSLIGLDPDEGFRVDAELVIEAPFLLRDATGAWHELDPGTGADLAPVLDPLRRPSPASRNAALARCT